MSTIEEDLGYIMRHTAAWEDSGLSRAAQIGVVVVDIRLKLKVLAEENAALLRALEHLVSEERA